MGSAGVRRRWLRLGLCLLVGLSTLAAASAQPTPPAPAAVPRAEPGLPPNATTRHTVELPGRSLHVTAVAGTLRPADAGGTVQAQLTFIAYTLDDADPLTRPVTFVTNGGPGSASAWLQLGALGPWRLAMDGAARAPSAPPVLMDNAQTWLDFTDLVFLDPPGTGYSRLANESEALRRHVWSVDGDVAVLADAVRRWLTDAGRLASPKFFAGESYAGLRGPRLVRALASDQGVGLAGLILISPFMESGRSSALDLFNLAARLPAMAAVAHRLGPDALGEVEAYATGDYLQDLIRGERDPAVLDRMSARVAALTGLDPALVRRHRGRVGTELFLREHDPAHVLSRYDATMAMANPFPEAATANTPDPTFAQFGPPMTSAATGLVTGRLNWHPEGRYLLSGDQAFREWEWGRGMARPESLGALRTALAVDPGFRVLVAHGIDDLVTPYLLTRLLLAQIADDEGAARVHLFLHEGGHMFYTQDASRAALHDEARALVTGR